MCNCKKELLEKVKSRFKNKLDVRSHETFKAAFDNEVYSADPKTGDVKQTDAASVTISYFNFKKNGDKYKNKTTDKVSIVASYCMFCGEEYE